MSDLHKKAIYCLIYLAENNLILTPSKRGRAKGSSEHLPDLNVIVPYDSPAEKIASALKEAFERSRENSV